MTLQTKIELLLQQAEKTCKSKAEALYFLEQQINNGLYQNAEKNSLERKIYIDSIFKIDNIAKTSGIILPEQKRLQKAINYITTCSDEDFWKKGFSSFASFRKSLWSQLTDSGV